MSLLGFCLHPGALTETLDQAVGREQRAVLLPILIQNICFRMRNCPIRFQKEMKDGDRVEQIVAGEWSSGLA